MKWAADRINFIEDVPQRSGHLPKANSAWTDIHKSGGRNDAYRNETNLKAAADDGKAARGN